MRGFGVGMKGFRGGMRGLGGAAKWSDAGNLVGNLEVTGRGSLKIRTGVGCTMIQIARATNVQFTGKATGDFLKAGVPVEFTAAVDEKHAVSEAVTHLTIVSLSADRGPGLFAEEPPPTTAAPPGKADPVKLPGTCLVRGKITTFKDGKFVASIGHGTVTGTVDESAEINVSTSDLKFARKGDSVLVKGHNAGKMWLADAVTVQASEPLGGKKPKAQSPAKKGKRPAGADAGDDNGL